MRWSNHFQKFFVTPVLVPTLLLGTLSQELAEHTAQNLGIENGIRKFDIVGQKNHGVTAVGKDLGRHLNT